ncbi:MAG TPA: DUF2892 domain-containing protein [Deltaproteobacteria bacterium]|nr:MAG: sulfurtransferase [bacterium]HDH10300.1 DUF2892 domain-containing protein [Deltaproteobacteria bacterium]
MKLKNYMRLIPGIFIVISVLLGLFDNKWWFVFTLFVGLNMMQSAFTDWCLLEKILKKLGVEE